jgi:hypothetical protein
LISSFGRKGTTPAEEEDFPRSSSGSKQGRNEISEGSHYINIYLCVYALSILLYCTTYLSQYWRTVQGFCRLLTVAQCFDSTTVTDIVRATTEYNSAKVPRAAKNLGLRLISSRPPMTSKYCLQECGHIQKCECPSPLRSKLLRDKVDHST